MSPSPHVNIPGYELVRELGVGGMAVVYLAIQTSLDRKVALKVMRRNIEDVDKFERRFLMEGRTLAKLPHRNIVAVYDIVKGDASTYIAMEYLDGGTLHDRMRDGLSLAEAVAIVVQIAGALQFAHDHGVIHRDLKPSNIMFRDESTPVLTDFGIAKQQDAQQTRLTQTGMLVGTPTYMSPEQINALEVDGRSDLYSLGVMFYELLTGNAPFAGDTPIAVLMAHLTTPAPMLPPAFGEFQPVLDRMLAKNRDDRFLNLKEFTKALKAVVIANETLWARLQADPNQSSSEQLRALGFSISSQTAGDLQQPIGVRRTGQVNPQSARLATPTAPTQIPQSGAARTGERSAPRIPAPVIATPEPPPEPVTPRSRAPLWAGLGVLAAIIIGVGLWFGLRDKEDIDPRDKSRVDAILQVLDSQIKEGRLTPPPFDDNAWDTYRAALELAPRYAETEKRKQVLLSALVQASRAALKREDFSSASILQNAAKDVAPDDAEVSALQQAIADAQAARDNAAEIQRLLAEAERALGSGQAFGANGAYALLTSAERLAPKQAEVVTFRRKLLDSVLNPIRQSLLGDDLPAAESGLQALANDLGNDPDWRSLQSEITARKTQRELDGRINQIYTKLEAQIRAGKLLEPAGDSAAESLSAAEALSKTHPGLAQRRNDLITALLLAARKDLSSNHAASALRIAKAVIDLDANNADAKRLMTDAEGQLGETERKIAQALAGAQNAVLRSDLYAPAGQNAKELAEQVLKLDSQNEQARKLLSDLPGTAAAKITEFIDSGELDAAKALADQARQAHPADQGLAKLALDVATEINARSVAEARGKQVESIFAVAAARPLAPQDFSKALDTTATLLRANARDVDALTARKRLLDAVLGAAQSSASLSELAVFEKLLGQYAERFSTDPSLPGVRTQFADVATRLRDDEARRLAESAGRLVLLAAPWGEVDSVTNTTTSQAVTLPADRSTPLVLTVPAGVYRVIFKHPNARAVTQLGELKPKSEVQVVASFPSLSKEEYLRRAGL
ncbi:hypothetical protein C7S18_12075 [Ahniella affigens]|uniref:non-specific serine/threonine protein kinase n=1 Tax=Ahniella affigens TaxID=2021234 RepID=A0A2P1PSQ9_9GAMM|nr:serine/threonine-protein kinase [Ahniella affigens]AVP97889.1 hypothetical protein C7S18_12075 [Ahniella affigens]